MKIWIVKCFSVEYTAVDVEIYLFASEKEAIDYIKSDYSNIVNENDIQPEDFEVSHYTTSDEERYILTIMDCDYWWEWQISSQEIMCLK